MGDLNTGVDILFPKLDILTLSMKVNLIISDKLNKMYNLLVITYIFLRINIKYKEVHLFLETQRNLK